MEHESVDALFFVLIVLAGVHISFAYISGHIAFNKGYSFLGFFIASIIFPLIIFVAAIILPVNYTELDKRK